MGTNQHDPEAEKAAYRAAVARARQRSTSSLGEAYRNPEEAPKKSPWTITTTIGLEHLQGFGKLLVGLSDIAQDWDERALTQDQLCQLVGITRQSLRKLRLCRTDPLPCFKIGRRILYDLSEVREYG